MRKLWTTLLGLAAGVAFLAAPALAQDQNPYMEPDDSWINIEGTVHEVWEDAFTLDYGQGTITVEMDDGDRDADAYILREGDRVSVAGRIDHDLFESKTIEAGRVYVESLDTNFYASSADEEDWYVTVNPPLEISRTELRGEVTAVGDEAFGLRVGEREVTVETHELGYDPLDPEGYQVIEVGDHVAVKAHVEAGFFEGQSIVADYITVLYDRTLS